MASRRTGELFQTRGELEFEWSIKDFFPLTEEVDSYFKSPKFYFAVSSWEIWIYPNGDTRKSSQGCIDLYLAKMSEGFPVTVDWSLKIKSLRSKTDLVLNRSCDFVRKNVGKGLSKIILRSELIDRKSEFTLSNDLTVICTLKNSKRHGVTGSLFSRYQEISDNLAEIYRKAKRIDCTMKVDGHNIRAHRMILETRSSVFAAMFNHDTKENQTGEIPIDDIEEKVMDAIVVYMYSGDFNELTTENALPFYAAADKS